MEEEAAAAAAAAAGGWVIPAALDVRDEAFAVAPPLDLYADNLSLSNVFLSMAIAVNKVWDRRRRERDGVNNLRSYRKETNAYRKSFLHMRVAVELFTQRVLNAGGVAYDMPEDLNNAVMEVELP